MPKSKEFIDSSDSDDQQKHSASDEVNGKSSTSKKSKNKNDPPAKRVKKNDKADDDDETVPSIKGPGGERLYEIGKLRYVSVSQFKGKPYINIREYYDDNGVQKPGKKGISLSTDQWEKLKSFVNQVDKDLEKSK